MPLQSDLLSRGMGKPRVLDPALRGEGGRLCPAPPAAVGRQGEGLRAAAAAQPPARVEGSGGEGAAPAPPSPTAGPCIRAFY